MSFGEFLFYLMLFGWGVIAVLLALAVERDTETLDSPFGRVLKKTHPLGSILWPVVVAAAIYLAAKHAYSDDEGDDS